MSIEPGMGIGSGMMARDWTWIGSVPEPHWRHLNGDFWKGVDQDRISTSLSLSQNFTASHSSRLAAYLVLLVPQKVEKLTGGVGIVEPGKRLDGIPRFEEQITVPDGLRTQALVDDEHKQDTKETHPEMK
jgi:hypothetical protein